MERSRFRFKAFMLRIPSGVVEEIVRHGQQAYPAECCGILVGTPGEEKRVVRAYPARNWQGEKRKDRYEIDPMDFLKVDRETQEDDLAGLEIIGFYHSHPDHPPSPSSIDRELAWPGYIYLIFSLVSGNAGPFKAWIIEERGKEFDEEPLLLPF